MNFQFDAQPQKLVIGIEMRTSNAQCHQDIPAHWNRFYAERIADKIPGKKDRTLFALYTDYEGDYTQPYSYVIGCEVDSLAHIPSGMVGKTIPSSSYAILKPNGPFPTNIQSAWQKVWESDISRIYTTDFELYPADFHPVTNPEAHLYIAVKPDAAR